MAHAPTLHAVSTFPRPAARARRRPPFALLLRLVLNGGLALGAALTLQPHTLGSAQAREGPAGLQANVPETRAPTAAPVNTCRPEPLLLKLLTLKPTLDHALARRIASAVKRECRLTGQDPNLVLSIMAVESNLDPGAVSPAGAVGLMQVMPLWKKVLAVDDLSHPETSIHAGVQVLHRYRQLYASVELTLAAYNRGPGGVNELLAAGQNPALGYPEKVLLVTQRLRALDGSARP